MKKYVYNVKNFLTRQELVELCQDIKYPNISKEAVLNCLNVTGGTKGIDLDDLETTIYIEDVKRDVRTFIKRLDFSLLNRSDSERNSIINYLKISGVDCSSYNLNELMNVMMKIQGDENLLFELNNMDITVENLEVLFYKYHIATDKTVIKNIVNLIHHSLGNPDIYLPTIRNKYYDENNDVITKVSVLSDGTASCNLNYFEGEIFESLSFKSEEDIKLFKQKYNLNCDIDRETTSIMHFVGENRQQLDTESGFITFLDEIYIIKGRLCINIYFDAPHFLVTQNRNQGIKPNELEAIRELLIRKTPESELKKYVLRELKALQKSIQKKEYIRNEEIIDENSKQAIDKILSTEDYGDTRTIYYKAEIVSSSPIKMKNQKNKQYVLKK